LKRDLILSPFFAMITLTIAVWVYMYARRLPFIFSSNLAPQQLTPLELARVSPPAVANPSDNLKNLFELPTIFYAVVLCLYAADRVDATYVRAAWTFVALRVLHSIVHCTFNYIPLRFWLYAGSALSLWFMAGRAALELVGGP
jgi:hypothetical protein